MKQDHATEYDGVRRSDLLGKPAAGLSETTLVIAKQWLGMARVNFPKGAKDSSPKSEAKGPGVPSLVIGMEFSHREDTGRKKL